MVMEEQESNVGLASESIPVPQVHNSLQRPCEEMLNQEGNVSRGKPRLRKKALHALILKQMEFYFSDANISKDRFLGALVKSDPYVDLNVFLRFNKIRVLTDDVHRVAKALKSSTILSLSEDGTKVCRATPINPRENCEACTVYVQGLPSDINHDWLSNLFSQYGPIAYVSIPRYKSSRKIKGFAFVEFDTVEGANKCLKAFQEKNCTLPSHTAPHDILSITTFTEDDLTNVIEPIHESTTEQNSEFSEPRKRKVEDGVNDDEGEESEIAEKKRKKTRIEDSVEEQVEVKVEIDKSSTETEKVIVEIDKSSLETEKVKVESDKSSTETEKVHTTKITENDEEDTGKEEPTIDGEKKKKRKRKRRSRNEEMDIADIGLQIMAKRDWKILRNKYLQLQRNKMKQLKQHLRKARWNQWGSNYERKEKMESDETDKKDVKDKNTKLSAPKYSFTPGVIIKIELDAPCSNPKSLKLELRNDTAVQYIDVHEGSSKAYVRCDNAEAAKSFVEKYSEDKTLHILDGKEEKAYWDKISQDREEKLSKKDRVKQRGRDKLLKKAEKELGKHIKFDEV